MNSKKIYFNPGPAKVPEDVMKQAHEEFLDYRGLGISVVELSHRSKEFEAIIAETEANLRRLLGVPDNYSVLFLQGGAKTQFDSIPCNLCPNLNTSQVEYIVNGSWSKMAADEAQKYATVVRQVFNGVPKAGELKLNKNSVYRYYCDNETIHGREFHYIPETGDDNIPLVCDMTSNFLSRPVDISKFGLIFASAQKNMGIAGLTVVIVRDDLIGKHLSITSKIQNYKVMKDSQSLYNTPPTFAIYIAGLCCKWIIKQGGLKEVEKINQKKAETLYSLLDNSQGFYTNPVAKEDRSRANVVFLLADSKLETKFLKESEQSGIMGLKGHRSVGGFRASIYNGVTLDNVKRLAEFMENFRKENS